MEIKLFEVRDKATFIPVYALRPRGRSVEEIYLLMRCGFLAGNESVILSDLNGGRLSTADPYEHNSRTFTVAHAFITEHWDELDSGAVVDVEFILKETPEPKRSEAFE